MLPRSIRNRLESKTPAIISVTPAVETTMSSLSPISTRSQSFASTNSNAGDLSDTARTIINSLCNDRDFSEVHQYVSPDVSIQYGDDEPLTSRDVYLDGWRKKLQSMPDYRMEIKEACVDEKQMKVWVRSEITGLPDGIKKESINMLTFNDEGILISSVDFQRKLRVRDTED